MSTWIQRLLWELSLAHPRTQAEPTALPGAREASQRAPGASPTPLPPSSPRRHRRRRE
jgi:hypothetical protein